MSDSIPAIGILSHPVFWREARRSAIQLVRWPLLVFVLIGIFYPVAYALRQDGGAVGLLDLPRVVIVYYPSLVRSVIDEPIYVISFVLLIAVFGMIVHVPAAMWMAWRNPGADEALGTEPIKQRRVYASFVDAIFWGRLAPLLAVYGAISLILAIWLLGWVGGQHGFPSWFARIWHRGWDGETTLVLMAASLPIDLLLWGSAAAYGSRADPSATRADMLRISALAFTLGPLLWIVLWQSISAAAGMCLAFAAFLYAIKLWFACKFYRLLRDPLYWDDIPRAIPIGP